MINLFWSIPQRFFHNAIAWPLLVFIFNCTETCCRGFQLSSFEHVFICNDKRHLLHSHLSWQLFLAFYSDRTEVSLLETSSIMAGVHFLKMRGLLPVLTVLFICLTQTIYSAPLSSYLVSSFTSPDPTLPFNQITINNITGDVYIGARQRLYQLNPDLTLKHTVDTGQCPSPNEGNINNIKLLLVAPSPEDKLITCGSCDSYCETRSLTNISHDVVRYDSGQWSACCNNIRCTHCWSCCFRCWLCTGMARVL